MPGQGITHLQNPDPSLKYLVKIVLLPCSSTQFIFHSLRDAGKLGESSYWGIHWGEGHTTAHGVRLDLAWQV